MFCCSAKTILLHITSHYKLEITAITAKSLRLYVKATKMASNLKSYGCRTMVGNWWEERIMMEAQSEVRKEPPVPMRDRTVDYHIRANEECPKWQMNDASIKTSAYMDDTNPERLVERDRLLRRKEIAERRRRLEGTTTITQSGMPGATITPSMLSKEFIDPNKVRMKTVYMKTFGDKPFESTTSRGINQFYQPSMPPRRTVTESTWVPGWGTRKY